MINELLTRFNLIKCKDTRVGNPREGVIGLSGGERKRLSIALEMLVEPTVIVLDEPTSGLDARTSRIIVDTLRQLAEWGMCHTHRHHHHQDSRYYAVYINHHLHCSSHLMIYTY